MENPTPENERPTTHPNALILDLLNAFLGLSQDTDNACRLMLLGPTGTFVADASLSTRDMQIAIKALAAAKALTEATAELNHPEDADLDPVLEQDFEAHCIGLDPEFLMDLAAEDPNSAVAAFDEITSQWDGGEL